MKLRRKGFTMVELVIVIAVVAVLAAVLIPTFVGLAKKANESVDIQIVRNMNNILKEEETLSGKPANVEKVKTILKENGISNYEATVDEYVYAWDKNENVIVLVNRDGNQKAVFPKEYEDVAYKDTWLLLAGTLPVDMSTLGSTLAEALEKVTLGQEIILSSNQTLTDYNLPANATINLNEQTLTTPGIVVPERGNVVIKDGVIEASSSLDIKTGATLTLENVTIKGVGSEELTYGIFPSGDASRVDLINCTIEAAIGVCTNANGTLSNHVTINIDNCTFGTAENPVSTGVWNNVYGHVNLTNSTIYAVAQCVMIRRGSANIDNCTLNYVNSDVYVEKSNLVDKENKTAEENEANRWEQGNGVQHSPVVVGDWVPYRSASNNGYHGDAACTLTNTTINVPEGKNYPQIYLSQDSGNTTTLTCDANYEVAINNPTNPNAWYYCSSSDGYIQIGKGTIIVNGDVKND